MISKLHDSLRLPLHCMSKRFIMSVLLFYHQACAEEKYVWEDAIVSTPFGIYPTTSPPDNLVHSTTFKDIVHTNDGATANQWITIDQGESLKPIRIYIQNRSDGYQYRLGNLHICIGNDPSSPTAPGNTCSTEPIHDGGIIILVLPAGRYIFLDRRDKADYFNLSTAIAFQTPNLLEPEFGANIIADYTPIPGYEKENLNTNLGIRAMRFDVDPTIDAAGNTDSTIKSCFKILTSQITPGDPFAMTIDLKKEHFIH